MWGVGGDSCENDIRERKYKRTETQIEDTHRCARWLPAVKWQHFGFFSPLFDAMQMTLFSSPLAAQVEAWISEAVQYLMQPPQNRKKIHA